MNRYTFLFKPAFFIFNLVFACWLVLKIEQLKPSDFGKHRSLFENQKKADTKINAAILINIEPYIIKLCADYKSGKISIKELQHKMDLLLKAVTDGVTDQIQTKQEPSAYQEHAIYPESKPLYLPLLAKQKPF